MHLVIELSDLLVVGVFVVGAYCFIRAFVSYCVSHPEALLPAAQEFYKGLARMDAARNREEWGAGLRNAINRGNWNNYDEPPEDERARYGPPPIFCGPMKNLRCHPVFGEGLPPAGIFLDAGAKEKPEEKPEGGNETEDENEKTKHVSEDEKMD